MSTRRQSKRRAANGTPPCDINTTLKCIKDITFGPEAPKRSCLVYQLPPNLRCENCDKTLPQQAALKPETWSSIKVLKSYPCCEPWRTDKFERPGVRESARARCKAVVSFISQYRQGDRSPVAPTVPSTTPTITVRDDDQRAGKIPSVGAQKLCVPCRGWSGDDALESLIIASYREEAKMAIKDKRFATTKFSLPSPFVTTEHRASLCVTITPHPDESGAAMYSIRSKECEESVIIGSNGTSILCSTCSKLSPMVAKLRTTAAAAAFLS